MGHSIYRFVKFHFTLSVLLELAKLHTDHREREGVLKYRVVGSVEDRKDQRCAKGHKVRGKKGRNGKVAGLWRGEERRRDLMNERWIARFGEWRESGGRMNDRVRFEVEKELRCVVRVTDGRWQRSISLNEDKGKEKSDQRRGTDRMAVI